MRNFKAELEAARAANDWAAHARIWEERRVASVEHDESALASCPACGGLEPLCSGTYCPVAESYTDRHAAAMRTIAQACERGDCDASELAPFADSYVERERQRLATPVAKYRREFPDFPAGDMPALPAFAVDSSWHNDTCPSFRIAGDEMGAHVSLFVDYADASRREFPDCERYSIRYMALEADNCVFDLYAGDDWAECLKVAEAEALAWRFAETVQAELTAAEWNAMRVRNRAVMPGVCASHDFRDANMIMAEAFEAVTGRDPVEFLDDDASVALWNAAWSIATPRYLTSDLEGERFDTWRESAGPNNGVLILYAMGQIDVHGDSFVVTVGNMTEQFSTQAEAERVLWIFYAKEESKHETQNG